MPTPILITLIIIWIALMMLGFGVKLGAAAERSRRSDSSSRLARAQTQGGSTFERLQREEVERSRGRSWATAAETDLARRVAQQQLDELAPPWRKSGLAARLEHEAGGPTFIVPSQPDFSRWDFGDGDGDAA